MKFVSGWWVTDSMTNGGGSHISRANQLHAHFERLRGSQVAVQAGGHIGAYPKLLSTKFKRVYTFEPERRNFDCLVRNADGDNVWAARGALGNERGCSHLRIHSKSSGGHSIKGDGETPVYRIDDMNLDACDGLFLDLEGYEVHALRGGMETIKRFRPLIVAEENKKVTGQGFKVGDIEALLTPIGYRVTDRVGEDLVLEAP